MARYNRLEHRQIIIRRKVKESLDIIKGHPERFGIKTMSPLTYSAIIKTMLTHLYGKHEDISNRLGKIN